MDPGREQLLNHVGFELKISIKKQLPFKEIAYFDNVIWHNFFELFKVNIGHVIHNSLSTRTNVERSDGLIDHYFHEFLHHLFVPVTCFNELKTLVQEVAN